MNKNNVIKLEGREVRANPFSGLLLSGAQKLLYQRVEADKMFSISLMRYFT